MSRIIKPESLHIQAYNLIKESIMEARLKPNDRVVEAKMASDLGVSRGTIREAVRMLIQDGLLIYNDGLVRVYNPSKKDVIDIFQCRESLEILALKLSLENLNEGVLKKLRQNIDRTKEQQMSSTGLGHLDQEFHAIIIENSNNQHLINLLEAIKVKIHYMRISMVEDAFYTSFIEEHEDIYHALSQKNEAKATELMSKHVQTALAGVLAHIDS